MLPFRQQTKTRTSGQDIVWAGASDTQFGLNLTGFVIRHPLSSFIRHPPSSVNRHPSFVIHLLTSVILCFPSSSAILPHHPSSVILCHLSSIICHPSSIISHPSSSVIHHPLSSIILVILRHPLFVFCHPCLSSFILHPSSVPDTHFLSLMGGFQLTFMTQLEKVIIFRHKHTHRGPN